MAKRSQKLKSQRDYKNAMKRLRGQVRFDYKLNRNLTRGQKSAISRALNQLPADQTTRFVKPKQERGQTKKDFNKQLNSIKRNSGQSGSPFTGVFVKTPQNAKVSIKNNAVNISIPGQNFSEVHHNINNREIAGPNRAAYLAKTMKRYENQGFTGVAFRMGTGRTIEFEIDEIGLMEEMLSNWVSQYGKQFANDLFANMLNGIVLTVRP